MGILLIVSVVGMALLSFSGNRPANLGVDNGRLAALPDSPNAVSTQSEDAARKLEPIEFEQESASQMMERIVAVIQSRPRTQIIERTENYLHVEFRSLIFRFVDDVEFYIDEDQQLVHFRSASRVGYSDMGVNRKRMERIVESLQPSKR